jgi:hypothetical protein
MKRLAVNFSLSEGELAVVNNFHPSFKVEGRARGTSSHPLLHCERTIAEAVAISLLTARIVDVGGTPTRHRRHGRVNIHSCCPIISASDVPRNARYEGIAGWCSHTIQQCDCTLAQACELLFVHSLYYFSKFDLMELLGRYRKAVAVVHEFSSYRGVYHGDEAHYQLDYDNVIMKVNGCNFSYEHSNLHWLRVTNGHHGYHGGSPVTLTWHRVMTIGHSAIYEFNLADGHVPLDVARLNVDHLTARPHCSLLADGGRLFENEMYQPGPMGFVAPIALVAHLVSICQFTKNSTDQMVRVHGELLKCVKTNQYAVLSTDILAYSTNIVSYAVAFARRKTLQALKHQQQEHHSEIADLDVTLSGWVTTPTVKQRVCNMLWFLLFWVNRVAVKAVSRYTSRDTTNKPVVGRVYEIEVYEPSKSVEFYRYGPSVAGHVPIVPSTSQHNEEVAVANRALIPLWEDPGEWATLMEQVREDFDTLFPNYSSVEAWSFGKWNSRFPAPRQAQNVKAHDNVLKGLTKHQLSKLAIRKSFVKKEKLLVEDGFDPRLIQGVANELNCILGPWMVAFNEQLKRSWSFDHFITYASGVDAVKMGSWANSSVFETTVSNDFTRFDATIGASAYALERYIYVRHGLRGKALHVFDMQQHTRGVTTHGVKYECPYTRKSGDPNTTIGNTLINALVQYYAYRKQYPTAIFPFTSMFRVLVGGDDSVTAVRFNPDLNGVRNTIQALGFKPKIEVSTILETEFYSSFFCASNHGYVLTPHLGKTLAKMGFSLVRYKNGHAWLRGVIEGNYKLFSHIPFMRVYFDNLLRQLPRKGIAYKVDIAPSVTLQAVDETATCLYLQYGLTTTDIEDLCIYLGLVVLDDELDHPVIEKLF